MGTFGSAFWGFLPGAGSYFTAATDNAAIQIKDSTVLKTATGQRIEFKKSQKWSNFGQITAHLFYISLRKNLWILKLATSYEILNG